MTTSLYSCLLLVWLKCFNVMIGTGNVTFTNLFFSTDTARSTESIQIFSITMMMFTVELNSGGMNCLNIFEMKQILLNFQN